MADLNRFPVTTSDGAKGHVLRKSRFLDKSEESTVILEDGRQLVVPSSALVPQPDGSFRLEKSLRSETLGVAKMPTPEVPVAAARPDVNGSQEVSIEEQLFSEDATVERVSINQLLDRPAETRQEGDVLIIPVMEEVLTVQKRLLLKEEIRITRRRKEVREPRRVVMSGTEARVIGADGRDVNVRS